MNILIVDDDSDLAAVTADCLEDAGFGVRIATSADEALRLLDDLHLVLLDINLPDGTGFELCQRLRRESSLPIIFISARVAEADKIEGLDIGADDYIPKPYSLGELCSRVRAHLRRCYPERQRFGDVEVDLQGRRVYKCGQELSLSAKQFELLQLLLANKGRAVPKQRLLAEVWGGWGETEPSTLTVHIRWLREKLEDDPSRPRYIKTVHRIGYLLDTEGQQPEATAI